MICCVLTENMFYFLLGSASLRGKHVVGGGVNHDIFAKNWVACSLQPPAKSHFPDFPSLDHGPFERRLGHRRASRPARMPFALGIPPHKGPKPTWFEFHPHLSTFRYPWTRLGVLLWSCMMNVFTMPASENFPFIIMMDITCHFWLVN